MRKFLTGLVAALSAVLVLQPQTAAAHGPSRLKTDQSVVLNATPEEVWAVIGKFDDASWIPGTEAVAAEGLEKGAIRQRKLASGETVSEELLKIDPAKYAISTRLTEDNIAAIPATNYALHITIKDEGDKAKVDLKGAFYRAFPQNDPPADQNDDAAIAAITELHQGYIDALAERFGKVE